MQVDIMAKKMLIDATHAEETRVVVVDGNKVEEFDFESQNKRQIAGNIYLAKVTRVEPSLQAAFVDYGGNRHGFLAFSEIHPDYYQIPVADREALMAEEKAYAEAMAAEAEQEAQKPKRTRKRRAKPAAQHSADPIETRDVTAVDGVVDGMETIDLSADEEGQAAAPLLEDNLSEAAPDAEDANETAEVAPESEPASAGSEEVVEPEAALDTAEDPDQEDEDQADDGIESVAQEDDSEDVRPVRKPRPRRYKIQEVIKVRQIMLIQVVKEERGNKGAALTTYLSLAGRYCVLMPNTARGGGISRKITNAADRKKLKEIATTIVVPEGAGLIVRTAGAKRTKTEIKRDYEYLQRMWEQIRELTLKSSAPSAIYEEGDLIKRSIRDLYNRDIDEVLVEGAAGYRNAKDTMKMIMPSHAKNVKHYMDSMPLFARFQVETFRPRWFGLWCLYFGAGLRLWLDALFGAHSGHNPRACRRYGQSRQRVILLATYAAGLGIPFVLVAVFFPSLKGLMAWMKRHMMRIERIMGLLLWTVGLMMVTGQFTQFSWWILEQFPALSALG